MSTQAELAARALLQSAAGRRTLSEAVARACGKQTHFEEDGERIPCWSRYASVKRGDPEYGRLCFEMIEALGEHTVIQMSTPVVVVPGSPMGCEAVNASTLRDALVLALAAAGLLKLEDEG
jgi:hypothetical protein